MGTILALDVGTKTIGIARARAPLNIPQTLNTLARRSVRKDAHALAIVCGKEGATTVVVGLPYELNGNEGRSARLARQVGEALGELTGLPIHYQDERFSTVEASRRLYAQGLSSREQRSRIDAAAAAVILEDWLESKTKG